jgi:hypothetical protein
MVAHETRHQNPLTFYPFERGMACFFEREREREMGWEGGNAL